MPPRLHERVHHVTLFVVAFKAECRTVVGFAQEGRVTIGRAARFVDVMATRALQFAIAVKVVIHVLQPGIRRLRGCVDEGNGVIVGQVTAHQGASRNRVRRHRRGATIGDRVQTHAPVMAGEADKGSTIDGRTVVRRVRIDRAAPVGRIRRGGVAAVPERNLNRCCVVGSVAEDADFRLIRRFVVSDPGTRREIMCRSNDAVLCRCSANKQYYQESGG